MNEWEEKFQRLKRHALYPFAKYREDESQYMLLELFWTYLFKSVVGGDPNGEWSSWRAPDPDREGNPIFSAANLRLARGTTVTRHPGPEDPDVKIWGYFPFQPYLNHSSPEEATSNQAILEFCFLADVSEESEAYARKFWKWFCIDGVSEVQMEAELTRYEDAVGMKGPAKEGE
jgi:hypothetical protein